MTSNILTKSLLAVLLALLVLPGASVALAADIAAKRAAVAPAGTMQNICTNLSTMKTSALARLDERAGAVGGRHDDRRTTVDTARTERMSTLTAKRTEHDTARDAQYASLRARATTTEQKAAVESFITATESAVTVRKASIDASIKAFEDGVASLRTTVDTTTTDLKGKVSAGITETFDAAQAACDASKTTPEVVAILKSGMEALKAEHDSHPEQYSFKEEFEALRTTRQSAEKAAVLKFNTDFEAAKAALKTAFSKS